jgi:Flp pilus assembly pilin Flp
MPAFFIRASIALKSRSEGQAMVEYALILGLVSIIGVTVLGLIGTDVNDVFSKVESKFP